MYWVAIAYAVSTPIVVFTQIKLKPKRYNDPLERLRHKASDVRPSGAWCFDTAFSLFSMFWLIALGPLLVAIIAAIFACSVPVIFVADKAFGVNLLNPKAPE